MYGKIVNSFVEKLQSKLIGILHHTPQTRKNEFLSQFWPIIPLNGISGFAPLAADRLTLDRLAADRLTQDRLTQDRSAADRLTQDRIAADKLTQDILAADRLTQGRLVADR